MSEYVCGVDGCDRPTHDWTICSTCSATLERDLAEVPAYRAELETTLARQTSMGERHGGRSAEKPLPYDPRASEALYILRSTLVGWVRVAVEEDDADWPEDTLDAMAALLLSRMGWLRTHKAGAEAVDEIGAAMLLVRRTVDRPADRWYAGTCRADHEGQECPQELYARPWAHEFTCPTCGTTWDAQERREWLLDAVEDELAHASQLAAAVTSLGQPVTADRIRQWASRGRIFHRTVDARKRPLYLVRDVLDLLHGERRRVDRCA